jgi:hypothetical protein
VVQQIEGGRLVKHLLKYLRGEGVCQPRYARPHSQPSTPPDREESIPTIRL